MEIEQIKIENTTVKFFDDNIEEDEKNSIKLLEAFILNTLKN